MITADEVLKFAADCKRMAKVSRSKENKSVWIGLAQRWVRCAELMNEQTRLLDQRKLEKRQRANSHHDRLSRRTAQAA
jgi:hypothetical protein